MNALSRVVEAAAWFEQRQKMHEEDLRMGPPPDWPTRGAAFTYPVVWARDPYVCGHVVVRSSESCIVRVRGLVEDAHLKVSVDNTPQAEAPIAAGTRLRIVFYMENRGRARKREVTRAVAEMASRTTLDYGVAKNIAVRSHIGGLLRKWAAVPRPYYSGDPGPAHLFARMRHVRDHDAETPEVYYDCTDLVGAAQASDPAQFLRGLLWLMASVLGEEPEPPPEDRGGTLKEWAGELFWWATLVSEQSEASSVYKQAYGGAADVVHATGLRMRSAMADVFCDALYHVHVEDWDVAADLVLAFLCFHHNRLQDKLDELSGSP